MQSYRPANPRGHLLVRSLLVAAVCISPLLAITSYGSTTAEEPQAWDKLAGQPVDIAPWAYAWRADLAIQEKPEAYFIPHRLERMDKVYRTAYTALPQPELKSIYYNMPDLLNPLLPKPKGQLLAGLLWTGKLAEYQVELHWPPAVREVPSPDAVEVRAYPTSYGWFGWTVDKVLGQPEVSADGRTWTYRSPGGGKMDFCYSVQVDAATEMVAVFCEDRKAPTGVKPAVPAIRVTSPKLGAWKRMDLEIEWGFLPGTEKAGFDGRVESSGGMIGPVTPLAGDQRTRMTGAHSWQSRGARGARRGIVVPLLCASGEHMALDTRVTVWSGTNGFTFRPRNLEDGPILIPEPSLCVTRAGSGKTARQIAGELAAANPKRIRQMTRDHREAASWEEAMQEVRMWTCPTGTVLSPFPKVEDPPMRVELPDAGWTDAWRAACFQLKGRHLWGGLAFEVGRVAHNMDMVGLHDEAAKVYEHFLKGPGAKSDGDYADGNGALEWATNMRHDMGYSHDGTHASTGRLLFGMAERYFLTGDKAWFQKNRPRLQSAADWIIRERNGYMKDIPNRNDLFVAGLMPPCMLGDYALPACDWHWYYCDNAFALQGLRRFADAVAEFDPEAGRKYHAEAAAFQHDLRRVVDRDSALAPVRRARDGTFHSFIPRMADARGLTGPELGAPQFPDCDMFMGALPLAEPFAALDARDRRMIGTLDAMEDMGTPAKSVEERAEARRKKGLPADDAWFWHTFACLPKASHNANIYLLQDDVPAFLRFWMNEYALMVGANGKLWEHWRLPGGWPNSQPGDFAPCDNPDNGTAGWFLENFRNLLVMEDGPSLWIARATPRAWLEQGRKMSVSNAPTCFGTLAYEIVSDADHGRINATVELPDRNPPKTVLLRLRHPQAAPIKSVQVNGKRWTRFRKDQEVIELTGLKGTVAVVAKYVERGALPIGQ